MKTTSQCRLDVGLHVGDRSCGLKAFQHTAVFRYEELGENDQ